LFITFHFVLFCPFSFFGHCLFFDLPTLLIYSYIINIFFSVLKAKFAFEIFNKLAKTYGPVMTIYYGTFHLFILPRIPLYFVLFFYYVGQTCCTCIF
jgi:hypothetical protein